MAITTVFYNLVHSRKCFWLLGTSALVVLEIIKNHIYKFLKNIKINFRHSQQ
jgi:hypothetical protein